MAESFLWYFPGIRFKLTQIMKTRLFCAFLLIAQVSFGFDAVLTDDTTLTLTGHATNMGTKPTLSVDTKHDGLVQFDLAGLPPNTSSTNVRSAALTVFVGNVTLPKGITSGTVNLLQVSGTWNELEIPSGLTFSSIQRAVFNHESKDSFVRFDVTALVKQWIDGAVDNDGLALAAASGTRSGVALSLDSKENSATSHPAVLQIELGPPGKDFADFYALMPSDNSATVTAGTDVDFPEDGPSSGTGLIARTGANTFELSDIGIYLITFQVSVNQAGQLDLTLNGTEMPSTVVGRATGTSQIVGTCMVTTTSANSILTVRNPSGNSTALTITPEAGGTKAVSAHLDILRLQ